MPRLPQPGTDDGVWGDLLNEFLLVEHNGDGTLKLGGTISGKYTKPATGIPESDLASNVQAKLNASATDVSDLFNITSNTTDDITESSTKKFLLESDKNKLDGIASGAEVNVQPDWNATNGDAHILNKPTIPTIPVQSVNTKTGSVVISTDDLSDEGNVNKFVTAADLTKLNTVAAGAETNVQSDWNATSGDAFILNKPIIPTIPVQSVNTKTGAVVLTTDDISDANSTSQYISVAEKTKLSAITGTNTGDQDLSGLVSKTTTVGGHPLSGNVTITKSDIGLSNVDNTSDTAKPLSTAMQAALDAKANTASLAPVATSGSYNSLSDKPSIPLRLNPTIVITSSYTAAANDLVMVDASAGSVTVNLPAAATSLHIAVKKIDASANTVIVQRAGSDTIGAALSTTITLRIQDETRTFIGRTGSWVIASSSYPLASLDARYGLVSSTHLIAWTNSEAYTMLSVSRDVNGAINTASIQWPDGSTGMLTTDVKSTTFPGAIDAYRVTYVTTTGMTRTVTQTAITRNTNGSIAAQPALVIT